MKAMHARAVCALDIAKRIVDKHRTRRINTITAAEQIVNLPFWLDHMLIAGNNPAVKERIKQMRILLMHKFKTLLGIIGEQIELLACALAAPRGILPQSAS